MFSRRWLLNGFLLLAIILIVWLGGFFDAQHEAGPVSTAAGFDPGAIERIEILDPGASLVLVRDGVRWSIVEPLKWAANRSAVERLFAIPVTGDALPLESGDLDPMALGFDDSTGGVRLGDIRVRFGIANNVGDRRYTMIDDVIYLLPDLHAPLIAQGLPAFVDRRLLPPELELTRLALPEATIQRREQAWQSPALPGSQAADIAAAWQTQEASRVAAYDQSASDAIEIIASIAGMPEIGFLLLSNRPEIVIANPSLGLRYHFHSALRNILLPSVPE